jgi:hypothetical protein
MTTAKDFAKHARSVEFKQPEAVGGFTFTNPQGVSVPVTEKEYASLRDYANRNAIRLLDMERPRGALAMVEYKAECAMNNRIRRLLDSLV